ncbi:hypothetical protein CFOL_v3_03609 [Cephalotus follicularis]|uniref:Uncharacterized protein n=1 Tax=Cephalotus follicularis TaxID=3775 RepID=A0A1Q3AWI1_CEPFO|nr:hypothetical protein CFOL_v3_03609 [Cephalotus follicularis]
MTPVSNSTIRAVDARFLRSNSPIPYLFGSLALMMGLISLSLIILACSYRKPCLIPHAPSDDIEKPAKQIELKQPEMEPKIVVLMPGDAHPTYLAKPAHLLDLP